MTAHRPLRQLISRSHGKSRRALRRCQTASDQRAAHCTTPARRFHFPGNVPVTEPMLFGTGIGVVSEELRLAAIIPGRMRLA